LQASQQISTITAAVISGGKNEGTKQRIQAIHLRVKSKFVFGLFMSAANYFARLLLAFPGQICQPAGR